MFAMDACEGVIDWALERRLVYLFDLPVSSPELKHLIQLQNIFAASEKARQT